MASRNPREPFIRITVSEANQMMNDGDSVHVVDVREPHEFETGHVRGSQLIPEMLLLTRRAALPRDGKIIFVCRVGQRSIVACEMAAALGLDPDNLFNMEGGTEAWARAGLPLER
jgi:rhodanese-related sulfurtransferase